MRDAQLRCFAERRPDGRWYAHCIDLTLDAEAPSYESAVEKLDAAIQQYLDWGAGCGLSWRELRRRSPLTFRIRYLRAWLLTHLSGLHRPRQAAPPVARHATFVRQPRLTRA